MVETSKVISIVISFRNEEDVLGELIDRIARVFVDRDYSYEIIFVNDASIDQSLRLLRERRKDNRSIKIITMSRRFGGTPCILAGIANASGDAIIYMAADLQDPPELIPSLIEKWREGWDIVHTKRVRRIGENRLRVYLTKIAYWLINIFSDISIPKDVGDFKLMSRQAADSIIDIKEVDPFMRGLSIWVGYPQTYISYERQPRAAGKSKFPLFGSINPYSELMRGITGFSLLPLYFSLYIGLGVSIFSVIYICVIIFQRIFLGTHLAGWPALMVTMLFLGGVILFVMGILGVYVGRIYREVRGRPRYIIQSKEGW